MKESFNHEEYRDSLAEDLKGMREKEDGGELAKKTLEDTRKLDEYIESKEAHRKEVSQEFHQIQQDEIKERIALRIAEFEDEFMRQEAFELNTKLLAVINDSEPSRYNFIRDYKILKDTFGGAVGTGRTDEVRVVQNKFANKEPIEKTELVSAIRSGLLGYEGDAVVVGLQEAHQFGLLSDEDVKEAFLELIESGKTVKFENGRTVNFNDIYPAELLIHVAETFPNIISQEDLSPHINELRDKIKEGTFDGSRGYFYSALIKNKVMTTKDAVGMVEDHKKNEEDYDSIGTGYKISILEEAISSGLALDKNIIGSAMKKQIDAQEARCARDGKLDNTALVRHEGKKEIKVTIADTIEEERSSCRNIGLSV